MHPTAVLDLAWSEKNAPKISETVHILEGKATLFKRPTSPIWHLRYKAHGTWERMTTKCDNLDDAKQAGVNIVMNAMFREKNNLPIVSKRFKAVAKLAIVNRPGN